MFLITLLKYLLPVILPSFISFLLNKTKNKFIKYLAPLISIIIAIIFLVKYNAFDSDDEMATLVNLYNVIFAYIYGLGFLFSLTFCIIKDLPYFKKKK